MREHPGMFQAKQGRCKRLAQERGFGYKTTGRNLSSGTTKKAFIIGCMQGRQS